MRHRPGYNSKKKRSARSMKHYTPCFSIKLLVLEECDNTWCYTPVWPNMDSRRVTPPKKCKRLNHVSSRVCTVSLFTTGQKNIILEGFPKSTTRFKSRNSSRGLSPALCSLRSFSVTFQVDINNPVQFTPFFWLWEDFIRGKNPSLMQVEDLTVRNPCEGWPYYGLD